MALLALGSITVAADGEVNKTGECAELFDLLYAAAETAAGYVGASLPTGADSVPLKRGIAIQATALATYVYTALTTRATAKVATTDAALQRLPLVVLPNEDTQGPTLDKFLTIV